MKCERSSKTTCQGHSCGRPATRGRCEKHKGHPADATPSTVARAAKNFVAETGRIEVYLKGQKKFLLLEQLLGLTEAS